LRDRIEHQSTFARCGTCRRRVFLGTGQVRDEYFTADLAANLAGGIRGGVNVEVKAARIKRGELIRAQYGGRKRRGAARDCHREDDGASDAGLRGMDVCKGRHQAIDRDSGADGARAAVQTQRRVADGCRGYHVRRFLFAGQRDLGDLRSDLRSERRSERRIISTAAGRQTGREQNKRGGLPIEE
jgi:hypothetical protein